MELTPEEAEFIRNFRRLKPRDQGYIESFIEELGKDKKKRDFKIYENGKEAEED